MKVSLREHIEALLREKDLRYEQRYEAQQEANRNAFLAAKEAREIKDRADKEALELAREIQKYKDEKANNLRDQIGAERGLYPTKDDLKAAVEKLEISIAPVLTQMAMQRGKSSGLDKGWAILISVIGLAATVIGIFAFISK